MAKSQVRLSRRPTSRSRTKRVAALKKTLAIKKSRDYVVVDNNVQRNDSPPLIDLEEVWRDDNNVENSIPEEDRCHPDMVKTPASTLTVNGQFENENRDENQSVPKNPWMSDEEYEQIMAEKLHVEIVSADIKIHGNRIVEIGHVLQRTIFISEKHARSCTAGNLFIEKETRSGLVSIIMLKCNTCSKTFSLSTEDQASPTINTAAVWGTLSTGSTYQHTNEFLSTMNIPSLSNVMFYTIHEDLSKVWEESAWKNMQLAGEEERRLAVENGQIDKDGVPWICVYLDGGWSKRSYGHNYNAASGVAVIIGRSTKKVLYMGVRNKFCIICTRAKNKSISAAPHTCFKNWSGSSSAMEADIIVEGFSTSEQLHGLRYKKFIADGDSSVYLKIQEKVSYGNEVSKIECTNHIIKNYGKRLYGIKSDTRCVSIAARKLLTTKKVRELQQIAQKAIYDNAHGDIATLIEDLEIGPYHVYGQHSKCKDYFCTNTADEDNQITALRSTGLLRLIQGALSLVIRKSNTLIDNETNNRAELFMSILARFNMGKRVNLTQRGSFKTRSELTAMRYNEGFTWHASPWKHAVKKSPGKYMKKFMTSQEKYKRKLVYVDSRKAKKCRIPSPHKKDQTKNLDYGQNALEPELSPKCMEEECDRFLQSLVITEETQLEIAKNTIGQFDNALYRSERTNRLTASNFGAVVRRRNYTSCHSLVKSILSPTNFTSEAIEYGKMNETVAISLLEELLGVKVEPSGLFIDLEHPFLGASPDSLIGDDKLVEVKCLLKIAKLKVTLEEAAKNLNICLEFKDGNLSLKKNHNYYYQIQGQLHIAKRQMCYFVVFVNSSYIFVEEIQKDEDFWNNNMQPKLIQFYKNCILPEIIRGNIKKGLKCVDPKYIQDAQAKHEATKRQKCRRKIL